MNAHMRPRLIQLSGLAVLFSATVCIQAAEIDFEGIPAGTIVEHLSNGAGAAGLSGGYIGVRGFNPRLSMNDNAAVVFDSLNPPGIDYDLGTTNSDFGGPGIDDDGNSNTGGNAGSPFQNLGARKELRKSSRLRPRPRSTPSPTRSRCRRLKSFARTIPSDREPVDSRTVTDTRA